MTGPRADWDKGELNWEEEAGSRGARAGRHTSDWIGRCGGRIEGHSGRAHTASQIKRRHGQAGAAWDTLGEEWRDSQIGHRRCGQARADQALAAQVG
jgi:hypothetical protein